MAGATMGTAPLKNDYQALERQLVKKMGPARPPRRQGASKRVSDFAKKAYPTWRGR